MNRSWENLLKGEDKKQKNTQEAEDSDAQLMHANQDIGPGKEIRSNA